MSNEINKRLAHIINRQMSWTKIEWQVNHTTKYPKYHCLADESLTGMVSVLIEGASFFTLLCRTNFKRLSNNFKAYVYSSMSK